MSWFGLFDRLRLYPAAPGWPLPGSQLRLEDEGLAALYRDAVIAAGEPWRADMFDLAGHHMARATAQAPGQVHLDARLTGRPQRILFGDDRQCGILSWHAETTTIGLSLPGVSDGAVTLPHTGLLAALTRALPVSAIVSVSLWAGSAEDAMVMLRAIAPWLVATSRAVVRLPPEAARAMLGSLAQLPASCAAALPCAGAADHEGRGEDPRDVLLCLESLSRQSPAEAEARSAAQSREMRCDLWNIHDAAWRGARRGGVAVQLPLPERGAAAGWPAALVGAPPRGPLGAALAALQSGGMRAGSGFDYVAEVNAAAVVRRGAAVLVVPQDGPALLDPALLPAADDEATPPARVTQAAFTVLQAAGWIRDNALAFSLPGPMRLVSGRTGFLLGATDGDTARFLTGLWPRLEYLLQHAEQRRVPLDSIDILAPAPTHRLLGACVAALGLDPGRIVTACEGVLYHEVLVVPPASQAAAPRRALAFDQFWQRLAQARGGAGFVSFSQQRPPERLYLTTADGPELLNGPALAHVAQSRGYHVVDTDTTDFASLALLMRHARIIVGASAALGWTGLASGCALGVLIGEADAAPPYAVLHAAAARGHTVAIACGSAVGRLGHAVATARFEALLDRIDTDARALAPGASR
jgi:hypothetical protein